MIIYNKIVRDNIPEIIKSSGKTPLYTKIENDVAIRFLIDKIHEEADEFSEDPSVEELADLYEVLDSIAEKMSFKQFEIKSVQIKKAKERGRFQDNIFLESVE